MPRGKDLDELDPLPMDKHYNEPPWRWSAKKPSLEARYPRVKVPKEDLSDAVRSGIGRGNDDPDVDYVTPDTLEVIQRRAKRKEQAKAALRTGGQLLQAGGVALAQGAKEASVQIGRYQKWVERKNAEILVQQEREQQLAIERQKREVERRKAAMELQRQQRELDLEERRLNIELMREEAKFQREFGVPAPQRDPQRQQGPTFGFAPPRQQDSPFGFGAPRQQRPMEYGFGTPAPQFRSPTDIVNYDGGINLFGPGPQRSAPRNQTPKRSSPKKRSSR